MALADAVSSAVIYWPLNEASGTRVDDVGSNDLTDTNTVASAAGVFGNAADFEAGNSESLDSASTSDLQTGDVDFLWRAWVKLESVPTFPVLLRKGNAGNAAREYVLFYDHVSSRLTWEVCSAGSTATQVLANTAGALSTGTWYLVHAWHDSVNNQIGVSANGVTDTAAHSDGVRSSTGAFNLGAGTDQSIYWDGLIDDVVLLKGYLLSAAERAQDYQGGGGVAFARWSDTNGLVSTAPTAHFYAGDADRLFTTLSSDGIHTGAPADGGNVEVWDNEVPSSSITDLVFTFESASAQGPTCRSGASSPMKFSCVEFNGSSEFLGSANQKAAAAVPLSSFLSASAWTCAGAFRADSITLDAAELYNDHGLITSTGNKWGLSLRQDGLGNDKLVIFQNDSFWTDVTIAEDVTVLFIARYDGSNLNLEVNTGSGWTAATPAACGNISDLTGQVWVGRNGAGTTFFDGYFGEWATWNTNKTGADLTTIKTYFEVWLDSYPHWYLAGPRKKRKFRKPHLQTA